MNQENFERFLDDFEEEMERTLKAKGDDYAGSDDRLANFRRLGCILMLPSEMVWAVYAQKHMDAILTWARMGRVSSEAIRGRFLDLANYCVLGAALASEKRE